MNIQVIQEEISLPINLASVEKLVKDFASFYKVKFDEASIHFVTTETISDLHSRFFNDPTTTDCISFPMDDADEEGYRVLGDVFVCPETAEHYVRQHGGNIYQEVTLYTVHGLLHLLGYDDLDEEERALMKTEEVGYLEHIENKELWIHP